MTNETILTKRKNARLWLQGQPSGVKIPGRLDLQVIELLLEYGERRWSDGMKDAAKLVDEEIPKWDHEFKRYEHEQSVLADVAKMLRLEADKR